MTDFPNAPFCFHCEQPVSSEHDLTLCSNCEDFFVCDGCHDQIYDDDDVCIHCRVEEVYMDKWEKQMERLKSMRRHVMEVVRKKANDESL